MQEKSYCVYICTNHTKSVLYTGITGNLKQRIFEHKTHIGSEFTTKYNVNNLVYYEIYTEPSLAIRREKQIKNLLRSKKIALITNFNPDWKDLYADL